ncbi:MAG: alanine:cation symporter family protein [Halofilum sp. (in: g-proteobacteria)]|nr:alanine:cation symporter family protein [Halofilum sp. (in: g-proteobacteria)]
MVIFGGIPQIARFASYVVPVMAGIYLLLGLIVLMMNITEVPGMLYRILATAFGLQEAAGGVTGGLAAAMLNGVKRGLFSNEAGMGSAPNIAACAVPQPHHPSAQGFVQALGVFVDTIVICTVTALLILLSGVFEPGSGAQRHRADPGGARRPHRRHRQLLRRHRDPVLRLHLHRRQLHLRRERDDLSRAGGQDRHHGTARRGAADDHLGLGPDRGHRVQHGRRLDGPDGDDQP